jgi:hypothetical protein
MGLACGGPHLTPPIPQGETLGDEVLMRVAARMAYSYTEPGPLAGFAIGGYSKQLAIQSALVVSPSRFPGVDLT